MRAPSRRSASTRSPIGRSCMRGAPERRYSPPLKASTAARGRNAVPALPRRSSADLTGKSPPTPCTTAESPACLSILTPRRTRASSMTRVSSASRRSFTRVSPRESAASRSTRFEMLFEPGIFTVPCTRAIGSRSRNFTIRTPSGGPRPGGLFPLLGQGGVARAARRGGRPSFSRRHHPAAFGGTPPHKRRGKSRRCAHCASFSQRTAPRRSFSPPRTRRGGARSATGWSTSLLAATPPRRLRRHPSSKEEGKVQALPSLRVLQPAVARLARPREKAIERPGVAAREHPAHALQLAAVAVDLGEQRLAVRETDVPPHLRMAGGDAGEVA